MAYRNSGGLRMFPSREQSTESAVFSPAPPPPPPPPTVLPLPRKLPVGNPAGIPEPEFRRANHLRRGGGTPRNRLPPSFVALADQAVRSRVPLFSRGQPPAGSQSLGYCNTTGIAGRSTVSSASIPATPRSLSDDGLRRLVGTPSSVTGRLTPRSTSFGTSFGSDGTSVSARSVALPSYYPAGIATGYERVPSELSRAHGGGELSGAPMGSHAFARAMLNPDKSRADILDFEARHNQAIL